MASALAAQTPMIFACEPSAFPTVIRPRNARAAPNRRERRVGVRRPLLENFEGVGANAGNEHGSLAE